MTVGEEAEFSPYNLLSSSQTTCIKGSSVLGVKSNLMFAVAKSSGIGRLLPRLSALNKSSIAFCGSFLKFAQTCKAPICAMPYSI